MAYPTGYEMMKLAIQKIGNSQGILLPRTLIAQCGFQDEVEASVENGTLVLSKPQTSPRAGWAEAFKAMAEAGDDQSLLPELPTEFDRTEWEW